MLFGSGASILCTDPLGHYEESFSLSIVSVPPCLSDFKELCISFTGKQHQC